MTCVTLFLCLLHIFMSPSSSERTGRNLRFFGDFHDCEISNPCMNGATCINGKKIRCKCSPGYSGRTCANDIDECANWTTDHCDQDCFNNNGGYTCGCSIPGYKLGKDGYSCVDVDECFDGTDLCEEVCINKSPETGAFGRGYNCGCSTNGYKLGGDGLICVDIDECADGTHQCEEECKNTDGGYTCSCSTPGYELEGEYDCVATTDIDDECADETDLCDEDCTKTDGGYTCSCSTPGYELEGDYDCVDIDECADEADLCDEDCTNIDGGYTCSCSTPGYELEGEYDCVAATDNDACADGTDMCEEDCTNTEGGYTCSCSTPGYELEGEYDCVDIDECADETDLCDEDCTNTDGGYICSCSTPGYELDGDYDCVDIDECADETNQCEEDCTNTEGGYTCSCSTPGYELEGEYDCVDIDECADETDLCDEDCTNTEGGYSCSCSTPGYELDGDYDCVDIDECADETNQCEEDCTNTEGGYTCSCSTPGYELDGDYDCVDIDECADETDLCEEDCANIDGGYSCSCSTPGYELDGDYDCVDMCASGDVGSELKIASGEGGLSGQWGPGWGDRFGVSVTMLGDLDGDGVADMAVGAPRDDSGGTNRGAVYILFMNLDGSVREQAKISGAWGGLVGPLANNDEFGTAVAGMGDMDGDGVLDLAVGCNTGDIYILLLTSDGLVNGEHKIATGWSRVSLAAVGDVDGDGVMDLAVGTPLDGDDGTDQGGVSLFFLNVDGSVKVQHRISSTQGGLLGPLVDNGRFGLSVGAVGDLDGDEVVDFAVGAELDTSDGGNGRGAVYIVFLNPDGTVKGEQKISSAQGGLEAPLELNDFFGWSVTGMGDLDGDGVPDLAVGAIQDGDGGANQGAVYILLLNPDGSVKAEQKISSTRGGLEVPLVDREYFGQAVAAVGDLDGDGSMSLVVGSGIWRGSGWIVVIEVPPGFVPGGFGCMGIDECADGTDQCEEVCTNTDSGYVCSCSTPGYTLVDDYDCVDIGECADETDLCEEDCTTTDSGYVCSCSTPGYTLVDDYDCVDVDECADGTHQCDEVCTNTDGGYTCSCSTPGFELDGDGYRCLAPVPTTDMCVSGDVGSELKIASGEGGLSGQWGPGWGDRFGVSVTMLGDLDGDGVADMAVGAPRDDSAGTNRGAVYILFMNLDSSVRVQSKISGAWGGLVGPLANNDEFGTAVAGMGDMDGDGLPDLAVGCFNGDIYILLLTSGGYVKGEHKIATGWSRVSLAAVGDVDGDGVMDLAVGTPLDGDDGTDQGGVSLFFLNVDGSVKVQHRISSTQGGLVGPLVDNGRFGLSVGAVGDLDGDEVVDFAVGAELDNSVGGNGRGAVYIVFLNPDGTVKGEQKISSAQGGLEAPLELNDFFGWSVTGMGDLDGDGVPDLAVGAIQDGDGGANQGAVYILLLNPDGSVKAEQKISSTHGGLEEVPLVDGEFFGYAVATVGDLDWDGSVSLVVGTGKSSGSGGIVVVEVPRGFVPVCAAEETCEDTGGGTYECTAV